MAKTLRVSSITGSARTILLFLTIGLLVYVLLAFVAIPSLWSEYKNHYHSFADDPRCVLSIEGLACEPLNIALVGREAEIKAIMAEADWLVSQPPEFEGIPSADRYLFGRKQDLVFYRAAGPNTHYRNHVRFWKRMQSDRDGRPIWIGAACMAPGLHSGLVPVSPMSNEIDVDLERDQLLVDLLLVRGLSESYPLQDFHHALQGNLGEQHRWQTDGSLYVGVVGAVQP